MKVSYMKSSHVIVANWRLEDENSRRFSQKQNRHVRLLEAMTPPTVGPMTDATMYMLDIIDTKIGSFSFDTM